MSSKGVVHVVDDDEAMRNSLAFLLSTAALDVRTHESADALLATMSGVGDGCIVSDVRMPGMSGIELLRYVERVAPGVPVVIMTGHGDVPLAVEAMKAGAFDFIEKPFDDETLLSIIHAALARYENTAELDSQRAEAASRIATLTERERQVFEGLVAGHANKTIAHDLGISPRTVEVYRANVMTKLQAASVSEVVRMAYIAEGRGVPLNVSRD